MGTLSITGSNVGSQLRQLLMADDIEPGSQPSYQLCKAIYLYHPLGQKMVEAPTRLAQSQKREITVAASPGKYVVDAFEAEWKALCADKHIFNLSRQSRIYGVASIAMLIDGVKTSEPLDYMSLPGQTISFNVFDPLNTAGSLVLNQDPNDTDFQKHVGIRVNNEYYHRSREVTLLNEEPIYIAYTASAYGFVGRSVYQRALFPLKTFVQTMITDDMVVRKAGVLVAMIKQAGSVINKTMQMVTGFKRSIVKEAETDNVISIGDGDKIETLDMKNLAEPYQGVRSNVLKNIATAGDLPAQILENETMVSGFGEGTEDAKNIAKFVDRHREELNPAYSWFDLICMHRAWSPEFFDSMQKKFPETYGNRSYKDVFYEWKNSFKAMWPSLLTEPDSEKAKTADVKLKAIIAALEVLLPGLDPENKARLVQWAQDNINELEFLFGSRLELDVDALANFLPPVATVQAEEEEAETPAEKPKPFSAAA